MSVNLPEKFQKNMEELLKDQYSDYLNSFDQERVYGLRVNTLKISVEEFLKISPFKLTPIPWCHNGFYYSGDDKPAKHPYYYAGLYYLQEPSAMIAAEILPIEENDVVLDGCAAPGGKSTEIAAKLNHTGVLFSNDISASRCQGLLKNIELFGVDNSYVISQDLSLMAQKFSNSFDKILLDVPCSGEGMFRKDPSLIKSWMERGNQYYADIQKQIVSASLQMLKDGGQMVYSTCTFSKEEDEDIIEYLLSLDENMKVIEIENRYEKFAYGLTENTHNAIRIYPFMVNGEGHFAVLIQKGEKKKNDLKLQSGWINSLPQEAQSFFEKCSKEFTNGSFQLKNEKLYFVPNTDVDMKSIRIIRSGLLLGSVKRGRFEPSTTLALALKNSEFRNVIDLTVDDERVIRYLKGETLDVSDIDCKTNDWVLVCVNSYPLGWGKLSGGSLKNKYEVGFRWQ